MSFMRLIYLILAILGGIKPMMHFLAWFNEFGYHGLELFLHGLLMKQHVV